MHIRGKKICKIDIIMFKASLVSINIIKFTRILRIYSTYLLIYKLQWLSLFIIIILIYKFKHFILFLFAKKYLSSVLIRTMKISSNHNPFIFAAFRVLLNEMFSIEFRENVSN